MRCIFDTVEGRLCFVEYRLWRHVVKLLRGVVGGEAVKVMWDTLALFLKKAIV